MLTYFVIREIIIVLSMKQTIILELCYDYLETLHFVIINKLERSFL